MWTATGVRGGRVRQLQGWDCEGWVEWLVWVGWEGWDGVRV